MHCNPDVLGRRAAEAVSTRPKYNCTRRVGCTICELVPVVSLVDGMPLFHRSNDEYRRVDRFFSTTLILCYLHHPGRIREWGTQHDDFWICRCRIQFADGLVDFILQEVFQNFSGGRWWTIAVFILLGVAREVPSGWTHPASMKVTAISLHATSEWNRGERKNYFLDCRYLLGKQSYRVLA